MMKNEIKNWLLRTSKNITSDEQLLAAATNLVGSPVENANPRELFNEFRWMEKYPRYTGAWTLLNAIVNEKLVNKT